MANTSLLYDRMNAIEERQITYQNETNEKFDKVFAYISDHEESQQKIFFDGQIYDAFSAQKRNSQTYMFELFPHF